MTSEKNETLIVESFQANIDYRTQQGLSRW